MNEGQVYRSLKGGVVDVGSTHEVASKVLHPYQESLVNGKADDGNRVLFISSTTGMRHPIWEVAAFLCI